MAAIPPNYQCATDVVYSGYGIGSAGCVSFNPVASAMSYVIIATIVNEAGKAIGEPQSRGNIPCNSGPGTAGFGTCSYVFDGGFRNNQRVTFGVRPLSCRNGLEPLTRTSNAVVIRSPPEGSSCVFQRATPPPPPPPPPPPSSPPPPPPRPASPQPSPSPLPPTPSPVIAPRPTCPCPSLSQCNIFPRIAAPEPRPLNNSTCVTFQDVVSSNPILGYAIRADTVETSSNGALTYTFFRQDAVSANDIDGGSQPYVFGDLENGVQYSFSVTALTCAGWSPPSERSIVVTPFEQSQFTCGPTPIGGDELQSLGSIPEGEATESSSSVEGLAEIKPNTPTPISTESLDVRITAVQSTENQTNVFDGFCIRWDPPKGSTQPTQYRVNVLEVPANTNGTLDDSYWLTLANVTGNESSYSFFAPSTRELEEQANATFPVGGSKESLPLFEGTFVQDGTYMFGITAVNSAGNVTNFAYGDFSNLIQKATDCQ